MMSVLMCGLMIAALLFIAAKASLNLFLLTGTISGRDGQFVSLVSEESVAHGQILCSVTIQNNKFRLSCPASKDIHAYLIIGKGKDKIVYPIILDQGHFSFCVTEGTCLFKRVHNLFKTI